MRNHAWSLHEKTNIFASTWSQRKLTVFARRTNAQQKAVRSRPISDQVFAIPSSFAGQNA
jgi:hypothetical protein